jgi:pyruvate dehydrogenase E2 component (dihydrolipoamide acetyltransferase)
MSDLTMPSLGADMEEGTLLEWLVKPGDEVHRGDVVAVVDTAKAAVEIESFSSGVLDTLLVEPGTTVAVGTPIAVLHDTAEAPSAVPEPRAAAAAPEPVPVATPVTAAPVVLSPLVRHRAEEQHLDLTAVAGTGPGGRIRRADVEPADHEAPAAPEGRPRVSPYARKLAKERGVELTSLTPGADGVVRRRDLPATETAPVAPGPVQRHDGSRMREAIAKLMSRSKKEIPHYYLRSTVDLHDALAWLQEHNRELPVAQRVVPAALLLVATARAALEVPQVNGFWVDDAFQPQDAVHLGVAVSLRSGGMVTPVVHDAHTLGADEMMAQLRGLVERARGGRLRASELTGATLTVTNLGDQGVEEVLGVIYPPQVALVGFGTVTERPTAVDGLLGVRPVVTATLSADHRATDGYVGARFLNRLAAHLQAPPS